MTLNLQKDGSFRKGHTKLAAMLDLGRAATASDPSDHVYGLMGMFQPDLSKLVAPNYDASVSGVFRDFALSVIDISGQLDIIYHGRKGNEFEKSDMPSWVPDWSQEPKEYITNTRPSFSSSRNVKTSLRRFRNQETSKVAGLCSGFYRRIRVQFFLGQERYS
jgi:hypothetical protein